MKVSMPKDYRSTYTIEEYGLARRVIAEEKEDEETPKGWAEYAITEALQGTGDYLREIYTASARVARNSRAWDAYFEGSRNLDVWVEFAARTADGFIEGGAYLSDIWQSGAVPYSQYMWVFHLTRKD